MYVDNQHNNSTELLDADNDENLFAFHVNIKYKMSLTYYLFCIDIVRFTNIFVFYIRTGEKNFSPLRFASST